jgi:hypothetical protein
MTPTVKHIGALTGVPESAALCSRLADLGLILTTELGYRCTPDVVAVLPSRKPDPFPIGQLCEYFTQWVADPQTTPADAAVHGGALDRTAQLAEWAGRPDLVVQLAQAASPMLALSLRFGAWGQLLERGQNAAEAAGDKRVGAYFKHERGIQRLLTGKGVAARGTLAAGPAAHGNVAASGHSAAATTTHVAAAQATGTVTGQLGQAVTTQVANVAGSAATSTPGGIVGTGSTSASAVGVHGGVATAGLFAGKSAALITAILVPTVAAGRRPASSDAGQSTQRWREGQHA